DADLLRSVDPTGQGLAAKEIVDLTACVRSPQDKQTSKKRKVLGWLSATTGLILLNISAALLSMCKSSASGWALSVAGLRCSVWRYGWCVRLLKRPEG